MSPDVVDPPVDAPEVPADAETADAGVAAASAEPAPGPVCRVCAAPREPGQDWCLACGTAYDQPRRIGLRGLGIATAATLALLGGAAVAAVAAIDDQKPGAPTVVATVSTPAPVTTEPTVATPDAAATDGAVEPLPVDAPAAATPAAPVTPSSTTTTTTTTTTKTTTAPESTRIAISSGSGALYDPLARALQTGDPQRAIDGDMGTSWFVTTPADGDMNVGYLIDLGEPTAMKRLEVLTKTPGMALRVLAATTEDPPPSFDDSGWTEVAQMPDAGLSDSGRPLAPEKPVKIPLETHGKDYRLLVIAIETPPLSGSTARFTELRLFG